MKDNGDPIAGVLVEEYLKAQQTQRVPSQPDKLILAPGVMKVTKSKHLSAHGPSPH